VKEFLVRLPTGVNKLRVYKNSAYILVECAHDPGYRRTHDGDEGPRCRICFGDPYTTDGYERPVKMLVVVKDAPRKKPELVVPDSLVQSTLF
jgi:hypothetical protein